MDKVRIGIVGTGAISGIYLENIKNMFHEIETVGACDLIAERVNAAHEKYGFEKIYKDMYELFADESVNIVLNLTRPYEHYEVTKAALNAGKHVYSEKPLGATFEEGLELVALAKEKNLMLGGAPDTFLGAGIQTCRRLIDSGAIGDVIAARTSMLCHGHETWHPDPAFYYQFGGGPMLDMGPYYITALCNLLGRAKSVTGKVKRGYEFRTITSKPHFGERVNVETDTHICGVISYDSGAVCTVTTSFDVYESENLIEIFGTNGTLIVPDPNTFGGPVKLRTKYSPDWNEIPLMFDYPTNSRALGLADMAKALITGRKMRAPYNQTLHVLEIMTAFAKSSESGREVVLTTDYTRGEPMDASQIKGVFD